MAEPKPIFAMKRDGRKEQRKNDETIDLENEVANVEDKSEEEHPVTNEEEIAKQKYAEKGKALDIASSPAVLMRMQDIQLEADINEEIGAADDDSIEDSTSNSQGSFVEDFQDQEAATEVAQNEENGATPARVMKGMDLFKKSWANMNDLEEDEMRNLDVTEMQQEFPTQQLIDKDGFQMILSKSKKKS